MIRRTVHEWGRLAYGAGEDCIPEGMADRLVAAAQAVLPGRQGGRDKGGRGKGGPVLVAERHSLRAGQVVGVVAADGCALEILPKIDGLDDGAVRRQVIHMLAVALDLDIAPGPETTLDWQRETLLDILIRLFARRLGDAVRRGMPRRYVAQADDLPVLRGRLDAVRQFTVHAAAPQRLACRFDDLSPDIALNQIMKAAVDHLGRLTTVGTTRRLLRELAFAYADIGAVPVARLPWDAVVLDRTNARWRDLLALARLLLGQSFQSTSGGGQDGVSLLFPMNILFEDYIARMTARALRPPGLEGGMEVVAQGGLRYCLSDEATGAGVFQTRPDILVRKAGAAALVIDTKWKRLKAVAEDPKQDITQADVYQMMGYGRLYGAPALMLLYPHHAGLGGPEGITGRYRIAGGNGETLVTATIDLTSLKDMTDRLRGLVARVMG